MDKKIEKQIVFSLLIVVIVLFSIAHILPWSTINYDDTNIGTFYSWGFIPEIVSNENQSSGFYLTGFFETIDSISRMPNEMSAQIDNLKTYASGFLFLFLTWLLSILTIIFSIIAFYYLYILKEEKMEKWIVSVSLTSIIAVFIFYIASVFLIMNPIKNDLSTLLSYEILQKVNIQWSTGFILFVLGIILITGLALLNASRIFSKRIAMKEQK